MNGSEHIEVAARKDVHQVVIMEVDLNTLNLDDKEDDVGDTKPPDTPRGRQIEKGSRCGKCEFCKQQCGTCFECKEMVKPNHRRKACRNRDLCKSPRQLSRTPSTTRKADHLIEESVRSKIDRLDKEGTDTILPMVIVPGTV